MENEFGRGDEYIVTLKDRKQVAQDTMVLWFEVASSGYSFRAGQTAAFTLLDPAGNIRTLSVASSPAAPNSLIVAMRMRKSAFKNRCATAKKTWANRERQKPEKH
jgi:ferredoxin-NADP reductase